MSTLPGSIAHAAVPSVPPQVDRTRRIARLVGRAPTLVLVWAFYSLDSVQRLLGLGRTGRGVLSALWLAGLTGALLLRQRGRFAWTTRMQPRPDVAPGRRMLLFIVLSTAGMVLRTLLQAYLYEPMGRGPMALFLGAAFLYFAVSTARLDRWWPRLALLAVYGLASILLLARLPSPAARPDAVTLVILGFGALFNIVDQCELYRLLGEAAREAGDPAVSETEATS